MNEKEKEAEEEVKKSLSKLKIYFEKIRGDYIKLKKDDFTNYDWESEGKKIKKNIFRFNHYIKQVKGDLSSFSYGKYLSEETENYIQNELDYIDDHGHTWIPEMISIINQKFDPYYKYDPSKDQTRDLPEEDEEEENDNEPEQNQELEEINKKQPLLKNNNDCDFDDIEVNLKNDGNCCSNYKNIIIIIIIVIIIIAGLGISLYFVL